MMPAEQNNWRSLYWIGGVAALLAAVIFRRNIAAEISLFNAPPLPETAGDWFLLLQNQRWVGLAYLNLFDAIDYGLLGLMFLALYPALRSVNRGWMLVAAALAGIGITISLTSNSALSMLSLSNQYAAAATETQRAIYLAAGETVLAADNPLGTIYRSTGAYMSYLALTSAGLISALLMLRSSYFGRITAYLGIAAGALDLCYCLAAVILPVSVSTTVALATQPLAGLLLMVQHFLIGLALIRLARGR